MIGQSFYRNVSTLAMVVTLRHLWEIGDHFSVYLFFLYRLKTSGSKKSCMWSHEILRTGSSCNFIFLDFLIDKNETKISVAT